jgi:hypothetical protein
MAIDVSAPARASLWVFVQIQWASGCSMSLGVRYVARQKGIRTQNPQATTTTLHCICGTNVRIIRIGVYTGVVIFLRSCIPVLIHEYRSTHHQTYYASVQNSSNVPYLSEPSYQPDP